MNYLDNDKIDSNGYVEERSKSVYGNSEELDSVRISPVYPSMGSVDDKYRYISTVKLLSLKNVIGLIIILVILDKAFNAVLSEMRSLFIPSIIVALALTFLLPNMKNVLVRNESEQKFGKQKKKYNVIWYHVC